LGKHAGMKRPGTFKPRWEDNIKKNDIGERGLD
jgi:hypothetical protein